MKRILATCAFVIAFASIAAAQDEPKAGVTMGYPSAVGVLWRATERIALWPEFAWSLSSSEVTSTDPITGSSISSTPQTAIRFQHAFGQHAQRRGRDLLFLTR